MSDSDVVAKVQPSKRCSILEAFRQIGKPPQGTKTAYDFMSAGPLTASPDLSVVVATKLMVSKSRKWLLIVDEKNKPLGLVDRQILLEAAISHYQTE
jgi:CBS domain-containing protein